MTVHIHTVLGREDFNDRITDDHLWNRSIFTGADPHMDIFNTFIRNGLACRQHYRHSTGCDSKPCRCSRISLPSGHFNQHGDPNAAQVVDLYILDVRLPDGSDIDEFQTLKINATEAPVLMMSAHAKTFEIDKKCQSDAFIP